MKYLKYFVDIKIGHLPAPVSSPETMLFPIELLGVSCTFSLEPVQGLEVIFIFFPSLEFNMEVKHA